MYDGIHTAFDVMKEFLITGAELEPKYGIPILPAVNLRPADTVDFGESFSRRIKNHRELNVNFLLMIQYLQDSGIIRTSIWIIYGAFIQ